MINYLKKYLQDNYFDSTVNTVDIFKTQNGEGHPIKKIVFYVFKNNEEKPSLIIYAARNSQVNSYLKKSIDNNKEKSSIAPKVLFEDYYDDIYFSGIEFIDARKMNLSNQDDFKLAFDYIKENYNKENYKLLFDYYNDIKNRFLEIKINIDDLVSDKLDNFKDLKLPVIKQHGDFQDNNIFVVDNKLKVIDWDDFGEINFPIFDFYTLYLKYRRKVSKDQFIEDKYNEFLELLEIKDVDKKTLDIMYYLYDFLRKDKLHNRFQRKKYYSKLVDKI